MQDGGIPTEKSETFSSGSETRHGTSMCVSDAVIKMVSMLSLLINGWSGSIWKKCKDFKIRQKKCEPVCDLVEIIKLWKKTHKHNLFIINYNIHLKWLFYTPILYKAHIKFSYDYLRPEHIKMKPLSLKFITTPSSSGLYKMTWLIWSLNINEWGF